jgi:hypothetical protein
MRTKPPSNNIEDYKITFSEYTLDSLAVIIGINVETCKVDLYGYDYDQMILDNEISVLRNKFKDYKFVIKRFDGVP